MGESLNAIYLIGSVIGFMVVLVALCKIFLDQGESWWMAWVPFYNFWLINKWNGNSGWLFLLLFLPYIGTAYVAFLFYQISRNYGRSQAFSVGCALVPYVFLPIVAFGRGGPDDSQADYAYRPVAPDGDGPPRTPARHAAPVRSARSAGPSVGAAALPPDLMVPPPAAAAVQRKPHPHQPEKPLEENPDAIPELAKFDDEMRKRLADGESLDKLSWELLDRTHEITRRDVYAHLQTLK